uniref:Uncharacterized protein n=1 Tax=Ascaris lumbricoides TaxID=6252 RepID=A0A0M3IP70_ASCLU
MPVFRCGLITIARLYYLLRPAFLGHVCIRLTIIIIGNNASISFIKPFTFITKFIFFSTIYVSAFIYAYVYVCCCCLFYMPCIYVIHLVNWYIAIGDPFFGTEE